ncbi:hypothetical protein V9T40_010115 [Parthenolecanium corni]|uniref:Uncharacterized protein n=1 Tax=Parthenolecanium corni TaxID=536013 RepID=A0AAN9Y6B7_9HEMI
MAHPRYFRHRVWCNAFGPHYLLQLKPTSVFYGTRCADRVLQRIQKQSPFKNVIAIRQKETGEMNKEEEEEEEEEYHRRLIHSEAPQGTSSAPSHLPQSELVLVADAI